jgi:hypothetical protein
MGLAAVSAAWPRGGRGRAARLLALLMNFTHSRSASCRSSSAGCTACTACVKSASCANSFPYGARSSVVAFLVVDSRAVSVYVPRKTAGSSLERPSRWYACAAPRAGVACDAAKTRAQAAGANRCMRAPLTSSLSLLRDNIALCAACCWHAACARNPCSSGAAACAHASHLVLHNHASLPASLRRRVTCVRRARSIVSRRPQPAGASGTVARTSSYRASMAVSKCLNWARRQPLCVSAGEAQVARALHWFRCHGGRSRGRACAAPRCGSASL